MRGDFGLCADEQLRRTWENVGGSRQRLVARLVAGDLRHPAARRRAKCGFDESRLPTWGTKRGGRGDEVVREHRPASSRAEQWREKCDLQTLVRAC